MGITDIARLLLYDWGWLVSIGMGSRFGHRNGKIMIGGGIVIVTNQIHPEVRELKRSRTITTRAKRSQSSAGALIPMMRVSLPVPAVRLKSPSPRLLLLRRNLMRLWRMAMARMETPMVAAMV